MNAMPTLSNLSTRELQVFHGIAAGVKPTTLANDLGLSVKTISTYRARVLEKLGVTSNAAITRMKIESDLLGAADHTLFAAAVCAGVAAWHPFATRDTGEVGVRGLRYWTALDDTGVPALTDSCRVALTDALATARRATVIA